MMTRGLEVNSGWAYDPWNPDGPIVNIPGTAGPGGVPQCGEPVRVGSIDHPAFSAPQQKAMYDPTDQLSRQSFGRAGF